MEKYRKFSDASTGINPFIARTGIGSGSGVVAASSGGIGTFTSHSVIPHALIRGAAMLLFPIRLVVLGTLALSIFLVECLWQGLGLVGLRGAVEPLLYPAVALLTRYFLFVVAAINIRSRWFPLRGSASVTASNGKDLLDDVIGSPKPGDVVLCNLVTPFDHMVLTSGGNLRSAGSSSAGSGTSVAAPRKPWRMANCMVVFVSHKAPRLIVFDPSPTQRWRIMNHILLSASMEYLAEGDLSTGPIVDLTMCQEKARRLGVPVLVFPEGTPTNGSGMLTCPPLVTADGSRTHLFALSYKSAAPCHIVESPDAGMRAAAQYCGAGEGGLLKYLFNLSCRGSCTAATSSARAPAAIADALLSGVLSWFPPFYLVSASNTAVVTVVRASQVPAPAFIVTAETLRSSPQLAETSARGWTDDCRARLCSAVTFGNPNILCKPLSVGVTEKRALGEYIAKEIELDAAAELAAKEEANRIRRPQVVPLNRKTGKPLHS